MKTWNKEEVWKAIHKLSDLRDGLKIFIKEEHYICDACNLAIAALREVIGE